MDGRQQTVYRDTATGDLRADDAAPIEATKCEVCGAFGAGDECCGRGKPFDTRPIFIDDIAFYSGRPGSTIRYTSGGDRRPGPADRGASDDVRERDGLDSLHALFGLRRRD
jgi:hypothetical protein